MKIVNLISVLVCILTCTTTSEAKANNKYATSFKIQCHINNNIVVNIPPPVAPDKGYFNFPAPWDDWTCRFQDMRNEGNSYAVYCYTHSNPTHVAGTLISCFKDQEDNDETILFIATGLKSAMVVASCSTRLIK